MLPLGVLLDAWLDNNNTGYFEPVFDTQHQLTTIGVMAYGAEQAELGILAPSFNTPSLLADDLHTPDLSLALPNDQGIQESNHLFAMSMNTIQG